MNDEKIYKYEMHIHTSPCSGAGSDIRGHIDALREKGFCGMVVTNHFYCGDTRIDRSLSWEDFVDAYRKDFNDSRLTIFSVKEKDFLGFCGTACSTPASLGLVFFIFLFILRRKSASFYVIFKFLTMNQQKCNIILKIATVW